MNIDRLVEKAISRIQRGIPLSVDFTAKLLDVGVDVDTLETKHG